MRRKICEIVRKTVLESFRDPKGSSPNFASDIELT